MTISEVLWSDGGRTLDTVLRTVVVYVLALILVRWAGRRTLAQLSAFDVVVTIAAGTVVGSTALPSSPTASDGLAVLVTLLVLQLAIGALRQRSRRVHDLVSFPPEPVVADGRLRLRRSPSSSQLTEDDVATLLRRAGVADLDRVRLALLEPTGKLSVLQVDDPPGDLFGGVGRTGSEDRP